VPRRRSLPVSAAGPAASPAAPPARPPPARRSPSSTDLLTFGPVPRTAEEMAPNLSPLLSLLPTAMYRICSLSRRQLDSRSGERPDCHGSQFCSRSPQRPDSALSLIDALRPRSNGLSGKFDLRQPPKTLSRSLVSGAMKQDDWHNWSLIDQRGLFEGRPRWSHRGARAWYEALLW
jgi:hypothetical protein